MTAKGIARRLIATHGTAYAHGLCRGRVRRAYLLGKDGAFYLWGRIGLLVERVGNAEGWA